MAESSLRVLQKIGWPKHASSAGRRELTRMRGGPREPMRQLAPSTSPWTSIPLTREYHASARAGERGRQFIHESTAASEGLGPMVTAVKTAVAFFALLGVVAVTYEVGQTLWQAYFGLLHLVGLF